MKAPAQSIGCLLRHEDAACAVVPEQRMIFWECWKRDKVNTPEEGGHPRSAVRIDPDRPALDGGRPSAASSLAADAIRRRPSGGRPPLPRNLRGAARFWLVMIALLALAPFLGLSASGGIGVRHCTHIFNSPQEIDKALSVVRALAKG